MDFIKVIKPNQTPYYELKLNNNNTCKIDINSLDKIKKVIIQECLA